MPSIPPLLAHQQIPISPGSMLLHKPSFLGHVSSHIEPVWGWGGCWGVLSASHKKTWFYFYFLGFSPNSQVFIFILFNCYLPMYIHGQYRWRGAWGNFCGWPRRPGKWFPRLLHLAYIFWCHGLSPGAWGSQGKVIPTVAAPRSLPNQTGMPTHHPVHIGNTWWPWFAGPIPPKGF